MRQLWDFHGGIHPPENKQQSVQSAITDIALPTELILPLNQHIGTAAQPIVAVGDKVLKGQLIADAQGIFSAAVHASTSGEIAAIEDRMVAHPSGLSARCIIIRPDGKDQWAPLEACENIDDLDHIALVEKIRLGGLAGMGGAGFPTAVKLNPRSTDTVETLILNGTECEPYITADDMLMREQAYGVVQGALMLARIIGTPKNIIIGIEDNKREAIAALREAAADTHIEIAVFPTKYPSGGEKQLIRILTGKEVPSGQLPAHVGVLVQNVGTAYAAWRAVRYGEPLIERVTTVVGEALKVQRNIRARIGTPISHIIEQHGFISELCSRLIIGGPMMGYTIENAYVPLVKTTNCILVPSFSEIPDAPPAQACIRCGMCSEVCPANLLPQQLYWYAQAQDFDKLENYNLMDCIECGACSYVCPSVIPLVQYYRASKATIRQNAAEKQKSDRARERFELRKERIAKAEAEKEAKRQARKKAAEEAKRQLEAKKVAAADAPAQPSAATSAASTKSVSAQAGDADDPEVQRKKLARALSSAESRVERLEKQLQDYADDAARCEKIKAQIKQAQLKVSDAKGKLDAFDSGASTELPERLQKVAEKIQASPLEAQQKAVATLKKRIAIAEEKATEAEQANKPTASALQQGVEKLKTKLHEAEAELSALQQAPVSPPPIAAAETDAATQAIARAQEKAAAQASMSPIEKLQTQVNSLRTRVSKAADKLAQAEADNSEHVEVLRSSLEKLQIKLNETERNLNEQQSK